MAEIRPPAWPVAATPSAPQGAAGPAAAARTAAQKAFFDAALRGVAPQAPARETTTVQAQPAPRAARAPDLTIQLPEEPPQKILRPGSIIDIRV
jgi:hypothetical protein